MKTITFFSYKGGVGRSMLLANVAWHMASLGKRVAIIDFDLEAPGLSLVPELNPGCPQSPDRYGLTDLMQDRIDASDGKKPVPKVENYGSWVEGPSEFGTHGSIFFLPCGSVRLPLGHNVASALEGIQTDISEILHCEYLFVDSRTGLSDVAGITTVFLPDLVFVVLGLNRQNIEGTMEVLTQLKETDLPQYVYLVPSLTPLGKDQEVAQIHTALRQRLKEFGIPEDRLLADFALDYHPQLAISDAPVIGKGVALATERQYRRLANKIIALNEDDPITRKERAKKLMEEKDYVQALRILGSVVRRPEFAEDVEVLRAYGRVCVETKNLAEAVNVLARALRIEQKAGRDEESRTINTALVYADAIQDERDVQSAFLEEARKFRGSNEERRTLYQRLSDAYAASPMDVPNLMRANDEIARLDPSVAWMSAQGRARVYMLWQDKNAARQVFEREIDRYPTGEKGLADLLIGYGRFLEELKESQSAIDQYLKALKAKPEDPVWVWLRIANIHWFHMPEGKRTAIVELRRAIDLVGEDERLWEDLSVCYELENDLRSAMECRKARIAIAPWDRLNDISIIARLGSKLGLDTLKDHEEDLFGEIKANPTWHYAYVALSVLYSFNSRFEDAAHVCLDGVEACRTIEAKDGFASTLGKLRGSDEAIGPAIEALKAPGFRDVPHARLNITYLAVRKRDWALAVDQALEYVRMASPADASDAAARASDLLERIGRVDEAMALLGDELASRPEDTRLYMKLAALQDRSGNFVGALKTLEEFERKTHGFHADDILPMRVHVIGEQMGDVEGARRAIREAIKKYPDDRALRKQAAYAWDRLGDTTESRRIWRAFIDYGEDKHVMGCQSLLGQSYLESGDPTKALSVFEKLIESRNSKSRPLLFLRLVCLEELRSPVDEAIDELRTLHRDTESAKTDTQTMGRVVRLSLRSRPDLERARQFSEWIDDYDVNQANAKLRSTEALYCFCTDQTEQGFAALKHALSLGYCHEWRHGFLHDLKLFAAEHHLESIIEEISSVVLHRRSSPKSRKPTK